MRFYTLKEGKGRMSRKKKKIGRIYNMQWKEENGNMVQRVKRRKRQEISRKREKKRKVQDSKYCTFFS